MFDVLRKFRAVSCFSFAVWIGFLIIPMPVTAASEDAFADLKRVIGKTDAIILSGPSDEILISKNPDKLLIPASTLKIFTSLVALQTLGTDFRFKTEFYLDTNHHLIVKGYGDPMLVSEVIANIATVLARKANRIADIVLDDSYFDKPLTIPGISNSSEPYDAPNGALCVNFNTVNFKTVNGQIMSAEPQTPMLPFAVRRINRTSLTRGRIVLSNHNHDVTLYSGHILRYFLEKEGVKINGKIRIGSARKSYHNLIYTHVSPFRLENIIAKLLEYSNNFTTNQLLIACGAHRLSPPGTLPKGVWVAKQYAKEALGIQHFKMVEGSGISRKNNISAHQMMIVLNHFKPHYHLLRQNGKDHFKTGNLAGVSTRVGYVEDSSGNLYRYVILMNTPGRSAERVAAKLLKMIQ